MKTISLLGVLSLFAALGLSQETGTDKQTKERRLGEVRKQVEQKSEPALQVTWYRPKKVPLAGPFVGTKLRICPVIAHRERAKEKAMFLYVYVDVPDISSTPKFFARTLFFNIDGRDFSIDVGSNESDYTDNSMTVEAKDEHVLEVARAISSATKVYVTVMGDRERVSFLLKDNQLPAFRQMVELYDLL
jgi:hypothetical protein